MYIYITSRLSNKKISSHQGHIKSLQHHYCTLSCEKSDWKQATAESIVLMTHSSSEGKN